MDKKEIIQMLYWHQPKNVQDEGIALALKEDNLDFVIHHITDKGCADNCAKIFISLSYEKCVKYFPDLFGWIEDLNLRGATEILEYLKRAPAKLLKDDYMVALNKAIEKNNTNNIIDLLWINEENSALENLIENNLEGQVLLKRANKCLTDKKFDNFKNTIKACGNLLEECGEVYINDCIILDIFYNNITYYLNEKTIKTFFEANLISSEIVAKSIDLSNKLYALKNTVHWNINSVQKDSEWCEIFLLADKLIREIEKIEDMKKGYEDWRQGTGDCLE